MEDNTPDFEAFAAAFNDTEDYQNDGAEETAETEMEEETAEEVGGENETEPESGETDKEEHTSESEEEAADGDSGDAQPAAEESFTIKVNKEERTVGREEMISLAQKGADYDRVKDQLAQSRQTNQGLQERLDKYKGALDMLDMLSTESGNGIDDLVEQIHTSWLMQQGKSEAEAKAEIRAAKAEKRVADMEAAESAKEKPATEDSADRATREVAEFHSRFPGVDLTEELCNQLVADVQKGMSLADAYQKQENAKKDARIAELEKQLQAEKQNKRNRTASPGSQNDSGGKRERSEFDEFAAAFR